MMVSIVVAAVLFQESLVIFLTYSKKGLGGKESGKFIVQNSIHMKNIYIFLIAVY